MGALWLWSGAHCDLTMSTPSRPSASPAPPAAPGAGARSSSATRPPPPVGAVNVSNDPSAFDTVRQPPPLSSTGHVAARPPVPPVTNSQRLANLEDQELLARRMLIAWAADCRNDKLALLSRESLNHLMLDVESEEAYWRAVVASREEISVQARLMPNRPAVVAQMRRGAAAAAASTGVSSPGAGQGNTTLMATSSPASVESSESAIRAVWSSVALDGGASGGFGGGPTMLQESYGALRAALRCAATATSLPAVAVALTRPPLAPTATSPLPSPRVSRGTHDPPPAAGGAPAAPRGEGEYTGAFDADDATSDAADTAAEDALRARSCRTTAAVEDVEYQARLLLLGGQFDRRINLWRRQQRVLSAARALTAVALMDEPAGRRLAVVEEDQQRSYLVRHRDAFVRSVTMIQRVASGVLPSEIHELEHLAPLRRDVQFLLEGHAAAALLLFDEAASQFIRDACKEAVTCHRFRVVAAELSAFEQDRLLLQTAEARGRAGVAEACLSGVQDLCERRRRLQLQKALLERPWQWASLQLFQEHVTAAETLFAFARERVVSESERSGLFLEESRHRHRWEAIEEATWREGIDGPVAAASQQARAHEYDVRRQRLAHFGMWIEQSEQLIVASHRDCVEQAFLSEVLLAQQRTEHYRQLRSLQHFHDDVAVLSEIESYLRLEAESRETQDRDAFVRLKLFRSPMLRDHFGRILREFELNVAVVVAAECQRCESMHEPHGRYLRADDESTERRAIYEAFQEEQESFRLANQAMRQWNLLVGTETRMRQELTVARVAHVKWLEDARRHELWFSQEEAVQRSAIMAAQHRAWSFVHLSANVQGRGLGGAAAIRRDEAALGGVAFLLGAEALGRSEIYELTAMDWSDVLDQCRYEAAQLWRRKFDVLEAREAAARATGFEAEGFVRHHAVDELHRVQWDHLRSRDSLEFWERSVLLLRWVLEEKELATRAGMLAEEDRSWAALVARLRVYVSDTVASMATSLQFDETHHRHHLRFEETSDLAQQRPWFDMYGREIADRETLWAGERREAQALARSYQGRMDFFARRRVLEAVEEAARNGLQQEQLSASGPLWETKSFLLANVSRDMVHAAATAPHASPAVGDGRAATAAVRQSTVGAASVSAANDSVSLSNLSAIVSDPSAPADAAAAVSAAPRASRGLRPEKDVTPPPPRIQRSSAARGDSSENKSGHTTNSSEVSTSQPVRSILRPSSMTGAPPAPLLRAYFGLRLADGLHRPNEGTTLEYLCLKVVEALPPSAPALQPGDIIVSIDGVPVTSLDAATELLRRRPMPNHKAAPTRPQPFEGAGGSPAASDTATATSLTTSAAAVFEVVRQTTTKTTMVRHESAGESGGATIVSFRVTVEPRFVADNAPL